MPPVKIDINNPATLVDPVTGLPMTQFEIDQLRHTLVNEINEKRERHRLRSANAAKGHKEPKVGEKLHVQLDSSITRRTRAGMRFEKGSRVMLTVVSDEDYAAAKAKSDIAPVVTVFGAERILEDTALHVFESPATDNDVAELRKQNEQLEADLRAAQDQNADLRRAMDAMRARRDAPESTDGKPTKLPAQAAARATAAQASAPGKPAATSAPATQNDFGTPADQTEKGK